MKWDRLMANWYIAKSDRYNLVAKRDANDTAGRTFLAAAYLNVRSAGLHTVPCAFEVKGLATIGQAKKAAEAFVAEELAAK